jgi:hypothetical protein
MNEYATLTDEQLNKRIAQALGYRVEFHEHTSRYVSSYDDSYLSGDEPGYVCLEPGRTYENAYREYKDDFPEGFDTEEKAWKDAPAYAQYSPSFELVKDLPYHHYYDPNEVPELRHLFRIVPHDDMAPRAQSYAATLERALAEAWLYWKEAQE